MPCSDSTSRITVRLDKKDRLIHYQYDKITCGQAISDGTGYGLFCKGKSLEDILAISFEALVGKMGANKVDDQFFLFIEWDALRTALAQYTGKDLGLDYTKYSVAHITYDNCYVEISQDIAPPKELPSIIPCGAVPEPEKKEVLEKG